ncbi:MAG TPA: RNA methyltransferase PUA domain-containing protein, partial [Actinomycetota bacterium]|nr:RNA methyltransferase PUA domain-containing protein [Actinomycetota bacterium]
MTHAPFFFVARADLELGHARLHGSDARHLAHVRRAREGQHVTLGDGAG